MGCAKKADKIKIQCHLFFIQWQDLRFLKTFDLLTMNHLLNMTHCVIYGKCQQQISSTVIRKQIDFGQRRNQVITWPYTCMNIAYAEIDPNVLLNKCETEFTYIWITTTMLDAGRIDYLLFWSWLSENTTIVREIHSVCKWAGNYFRIKSKAFKLNHKWLGGVV